MLERFLIDENIPKAEFACDLALCKGACCTMPGPRGAPLMDEEEEEIEKAYPVVKKYLSFRHNDLIEERGLIQGRPGDRTTQVVEQRACVFAVFENGIAKCAFEKAFLNNEIQWRKPISCHLFPIRVSPGVPQRLRYEKIPECHPGVERGEQEHIPLHGFLKEALQRAYGETWYAEFLDHCRTTNKEEVPK